METIRRHFHRNWFRLWQMCEMSGLKAIQVPQGVLDEDSLEAVTMATLESSITGPKIELLILTNSMQVPGNFALVSTIWCRNNTWMSTSATCQLNVHGNYHISDMIPVALPPRAAGAGLTRSLFLVPRTLDSTVCCVSSLSSINTVMNARQISLVDCSSSNTHY